MSSAILVDRKGYYRELERAQRFSSADTAPDITPWLHWFLATLLAALEGALAQIDRVLGKSRFWLLHRGRGLSAEQVKVLNRLLDGDQPGRGGFAGGISAAQYQAVARVSKATATRHLADLVAKGCLVKLPGGGRNTRYQIRWPDGGAGMAYLVGDV
jgi:Fic family protein